MNAFIANITWLTPYLHALITLIVGFLIMALVRHTLNKWIIARFHQPSLLPLSRFLNWLILIVFIIMSLKQLGLELGLALQAAGFLTVALGFGLQGIASNFVCGIVLMTDNTFKLGDNVCLGDKVGKIKIIQLLSVSLLDENNQLIRIPNELFFKSTVINLSHRHSATEKFTLTLFECPLKLDELCLLLNPVSSAPTPRIQLAIQEIDSERQRIRFDCHYKMEGATENTTHNSLLEMIAEHLTLAKINFLLNSAAPQ